MLQVGAIGIDRQVERQTDRWNGLNSVGVSEVFHLTIEIDPLSETCTLWNTRGWTESRSPLIPSVMYGHDSPSEDKFFY
jgi:hypothetical protein